jgi:hypothetical protein
MKLGIKMLFSFAKTKEQTLQNSLSHVESLRQNTLAWSKSDSHFISEDMDSHISSFMNKFLEPH